MRHLSAFAFALSFTCAAAPLAARAQVSPAAAVADASRPADDKAKDSVRKPAELIAFAGIKPGDRVMDLWPGGGYWSRIFSKVLGPKGHVYAYVPAEITDFKSDPLGKAKAMAAEPGLGNVEAISDPLASQPPPQFSGVLDVIWTFENYHDLHDPFLKGASVPDFLKAAFTLLKPGGVFVIVDHAAAAGSGLKNTDDLHRIDPAAVKAELQAVGFRFDGESKLLANPADPHTALVFDPSIRGKTDQFAYRFRKPK